MKKNYTSVICATLLLVSNVSAFDLSQAANAVASVASSSKGTQTTSLINMLTSQLGVTDKQAEGGVGSILGYAKKALSSSDYSTLASAIPNSDELIKAAPEAIKNISKGAGMSTLASSFSSLGLGGDMVGKFVPVVMDYFKGSGKLDAIGILTKLFQ